MPREYFLFYDFSISNKGNNSTGAFQKNLFSSSEYCIFVDIKKSGQK